MHIDWSLPIGSIILFGCQFVSVLIIIFRAIGAFERSIDRRFADFKLELTTFKEGDLRDLHSRVKRIETGTDEWSTIIRDRTHATNTEMNIIRLKIDRLENAERYRRASDHRRNEDDTSGG